MRIFFGMSMCSKISCSWCCWKIYSLSAQSNKRIYNKQVQLSFQNLNLQKLWIRFQEDFFCFAPENLSTLFCCTKYQIAAMSIQCMSCGHVVLQIGMKTVCSSENLMNTATLFANQIQQQQIFHSMLIDNWHSPQLHACQPLNSASGYY